MTHSVCPLDEPRGDLSRQFIFIAKLNASTLYLDRNQTYRGYCVLVYDPRHVTRIDELSADEWLVLAGDIHRAQSAIFKVCSPGHMNLASLGNVVPHLHWHLIPRYPGDPRWGDPIWTTILSDMPHTTLDDVEYLELTASIADALAVKV
jgi:ATP adenylyltransferase